MKIKKKLTEAEAQALIASGADDLPYRVINFNGHREIANWIQRTASHPHRHQVKAWMTEAEDAANNAQHGEDIIIEMAGEMTRSGNPCTLRLHANCFDWRCDKIKE